jgi:hypothetical protein
MLKSPEGGQGEVWRTRRGIGRQDMKSGSTLGSWQCRLKRVVSHPAFEFVAVVVLVAATIAVIADMEPLHRSAMVFAPR